MYDRSLVNRGKRLYCSLCIVTARVGNKQYLNRRYEIFGYEGNMTVSPC